MEATTKILARQLIRLRHQIVTLQGSRVQIRVVARLDGFLPEIWVHALYASRSLSTGLKGASKAMSAMNKVLVVKRGLFKFAVGLEF
ncbi:hypothetical protein DM860_016353 [Cuscuta australis]|uniref:Uncharacterized protein n=1 Tax=Cuscuta australis TaxID=267555 RepID=A0A328DBV2_9ASTE|nr:hypothetical protein DM860_016353 [Cuscuta australis]